MIYNSKVSSSFFLRFWTLVYSFFRNDILYINNGSKNVFGNAISIKRSSIVEREIKCIENIKSRRSQNAQFYDKFGSLHDYKFLEYFIERQLLLLKMEEKNTADEIKILGKNYKSVMCSYFWYDIFKNIDGLNVRFSFWMTVLEVIDETLITAHQYIQIQRYSVLIHLAKSHNSARDPYLIYFGNLDHRFGRFIENSKEKKGTRAINHTHIRKFPSGTNIIKFATILKQLFSTERVLVTLKRLALAYGNQNIKISSELLSFQEKPKVNFIIGLPSDFYTNLLISKLDKTKFTYSQDILITEHFLHNFHNLKIITSSSLLDKSVKAWGVNAKVEYNSAFGKFLIDKELISQNVAQSHLREPKVYQILYADDPGNYYNTDLDRVSSLIWVLNNLVNNNFNLIYRAHPSVPQKLVNDFLGHCSSLSGKKIDLSTDSLQKDLANSQIVVTKYSTVAIQAIINQKLLLINNHDSGNPFPDLKKKCPEVFLDDSFDKNLFHLLNDETIYYRQKYYFESNQIK